MIMMTVMMKKCGSKLRDNRHNISTAVKFHFNTNYDNIKNSTLSQLQVKSITSTVKISNLEFRQFCFTYALCSRSVSKHLRQLFKGATSRHFDSFSATCKIDFQREGNYKILVW